MSIEEEVAEEIEFNGYDSDDFIMLVAMLESIQENGTSWTETMYLCFLGAAICANNADMTADEFMVALRSIKVTPEGVYGEA
jgi:hypothetical protein